MFRGAHEKTDRQAGLSRRDVVLQPLIALALSALGLKKAAARPIGVDPSVCEKQNRIRVSLNDIERGEQLEVKWDRYPVFIRRRTEEEIRTARAVALSDLIDPEADDERVQNPEWLVVVGRCTHIGCKPAQRLGDYGGWYCFCHGSDFDTSGRVRRGPASRNLEVPPYRFIDDDTIEIGCG